MTNLNMPGKKVVLVTFADGGEIWHRTLLRFIKQANASGFFSRIETYDLDRLQSDFPEFYAKHGNFISQNAKGFGYWLWKPLILRETLGKMADDEELLLYLDAGSTLNYRESAKFRFRQYLQLASEHGNLFFRLSGSNTKASWIKRDLLEFQKIPKFAYNENLVAATTFFLKKDNENIFLVDDWLKICVAHDYHYLDDSKSSKPEHNSFVEHRHDQAILTTLEHHHQIFTIPDETYFGGVWNAAALEYPILATRLRSLFRSTSRSIFWKIIRRMERAIFSNRRNK